MPPMPPPPGMAGALFFGVSATMASVVIMRPATDAASCSATRTTFAGSTMPADSMSTYCSVWASKPKVWDLLARTLPTTIEPSTPEFSAIWLGWHRMGRIVFVLVSVVALADGVGQRKDPLGVQAPRKRPL